jgi:hypothetical protein
LKKALRNTTIADRALFLLLIIASFAGMFYTREALSQGAVVVIEVGGKAVFTASLNTDREVLVEGLHGRSIVQIRNGKVRMKESRCNNHICMKQGWITRGTIVCLPNSIVVIAGSSMKKDLDAITG